MERLWKDILDGSFESVDKPKVNWSRVNKRLSDDELTVLSEVLNNSPKSEKKVKPLPAKKVELEIDWEEETSDTSNFTFLFSRNTKLNYQELVDWRMHLGPVIDQKDCKACWAIVAADLASAATSIKQGKKKDHSAQFLLDCTKDSSDGCNGGNFVSAMNLIQTVDTPTSNKVKWTGKKGNCRMPD